ncbi:MAG: ABC transporter permease subunit [Actinobacteria bacterium]|nr:ABC transporter permease subunit [Actinomycetota bacterium]MBW3641604.1 ABC transporter permease subunit [Actinomycetota bacterium]
MASRRPPHARSRLPAQSALRQLAAVGAPGLRHRPRARAIAGSEEEGTLELLLANPVTRGAVVARRYLTLVAMLGGLTLVFALSRGAGAALRRP